MEGICTLAYEKYKISLSVSNREKIHKENEVRCYFRKT